jgi:hypothetical protein
MEEDAGLIYGPWEGGKFMGYITHQCGSVWLDMNIIALGIKMRKIKFPYVQYGDKDGAIAAALTMKSVVSNDLGVTRNRYRLVTQQATGDKWYEMSLTMGKTMLFDPIDLPHATVDTLMFVVVGY